MFRFFAEAKLKHGDTNNNGIDIPTVSADNFLTNALTTVYWLAGVVSVLVIIAAGIYYITSDGNPAQVQRAKNAILSGVVGLVVVLMAYAITGFVLKGFA